jgi:large conductance mechanosensitive channel
MLREFRDFVMRGNVIDMAVGFVIALAFGRIITSLVNDIIMPPIGLLLHGVDVTNLFITLRGGPYPTLAAAKAAGAPTINYGLFLNTIIEFIIIAFIIFLVVRQINRSRRPAPATKECPYCLSNVPIKATRCAFCTSELKAASR